MGSACNNCCNNADDPTTFKPEDMPPAQKKETIKPGLRRSQDFQTGFANKNVQPVVSRSGQHFDFYGGARRLDIMQVTRLQALVRGFLQRQKYKVQVTKMQMTNGIYFKREEQFETLHNSNAKYDVSQPQIKTKFEYSTGAVYNG